MVKRSDSVAIAPAPRHVDTVVVGAGPLAAACTLEIARSGASVALVARDEAETVAIAPWQTLTYSFVPDGPGRMLADAGRDGWLQWNDEADAAGGEPLGIGTLGAFTVARDKDAATALAAGPLSLPSSGAGKISAGRLARAIPGLTTDMAAAYRCAHDLQLDPGQATTWLLGEAVRHGAIVLDARAKRVASHGGRAAGVQTTHGLLEADAVINTDDLPLAQRDPGWVALERDAIIAYGAPQLTASLYLVASVGGRYPDVVLTPGPPGCVMITGPARHGLDTRGRDLLVLRDIAQRACRVLPELAAAQPGPLLRYRRLLAPDGEPVIGAEPRLPGLWHVCGLASDVMAMAPAAARLVADLVAGRAPDIDPAPFDPARLADRSASETAETGAADPASAAMALGYHAWTELDEGESEPDLVLPAAPTEQAKEPEPAEERSQGEERPAAAAPEPSEEPEPAEELEPAEEPEPAEEAEPTESMVPEPVAVEPVAAEPVAVEPVAAEPWPVPEPSAPAVPDAPKGPAENEPEPAVKAPVSPKGKPAAANGGGSGGTPRRTGAARPSPARRTAAPRPVTAKQAKADVAWVQDASAPWPTDPADTKDRPGAAPSDAAPTAMAPARTPAKAAAKAAAKTTEKTPATSPAKTAAKAAAKTAPKTPAKTAATAKAKSAARTKTPAAARRPVGPRSVTSIKGGTRAQPADPEEQP